MVRAASRGLCGKLSDIEGFAALVADGSEVFHLPEVTLLERGISDEIPDDAGFRQHPVILSRNKSPIGNAPDYPAGRLAIS